MDDFENKLTELHDRVLSKALTEDEQNSYTESLFESIKSMNMERSFGTQENFSVL